MKQEHDREEIIAANPLLDYCQAHGLQLKKDGPRWRCLCPLHKEATPSFTIDAEKQLWKCFAKVLEGGGKESWRSIARNRRRARRHLTSVRP